MWKLIFPLFLSFTVEAVAVEEDWRLQRAKERCEDFFARRQRQEGYDEKVQAGAAEVREQRRRFEREQEEARLAYLKQKKAEPDWTAFEKKHEEELRQQKEEMEIARRRFVDAQNRLDKMLEKSCKIPPDAEFGLE